jgi:hypothetical protein
VATHESHTLADAVGKDLGKSGNSLIPRIAALSAVAGLVSSTKR